MALVINCTGWKGRGGHDTHTTEGPSAEPGRSVCRDRAMVRAGARPRLQLAWEGGWGQGEEQQGRLCPGRDFKGRLSSVWSDAIREGR